MEPSASFLSKFAKNSQVLRLIERYKKEFEIFSYLSDRVPTSLCDNDWQKMLETRSCEERVKLWDFIAVKQTREQFDITRRKTRREMAQNLMKDQLIFKLVLGNELLIDQRQCSVYALRDQPTIALDLQFVSEELLATRRQLAKHTMYFISENRWQHKRPFPLCLINANQEDPLVKGFIDELGFFNRQTKATDFLPDLHHKNPFAGQKEVIYISRHSRDILDGPLKHDTYIVPVTYDAKQQSLGAARKANIRPLALPIRKYVKWEFGPMFLPLTNIQRVLATVSKTGGDWSRALHENISRRHLIPQTEQKAIQPQEVARFRREERHQIVQAIKDAFPESQEESPPQNKPRRARSKRY
ncbi:SAM-dependent MTase TRM10-type domain-containing protein [Aphelenchoides besseyi]|nr:SAM-dependent MTase TRM10-type domain-containing protein [Aphelenchoides besseyi]